MFSGLFLWIISWDLHDSHALLGLLPAWGSQCAASVQPWGWKAAAGGAFRTRLLWASVQLVRLTASNICIRPNVFSCVSPCQPAECQGSPCSSKRGSRLALGQIRKGKYKTFVKVSENLNSGPFMQGSQMLYGIVPKSKEKIKETHNHHNSCQNV